MRLTDIGENEKVIVALWIAEDSLEMIENKDEDYCFCKETIHLCWDWVINKNVSHLMLYERLSVGSGRSIADILLDRRKMIQSNIMEQYRNALLILHGRHLIMPKCTDIQRIWRNVKQERGILKN